MHLIVTALIAATTQLPVPRGLFPDHAVIGVAGGEDMVVAQELGIFEAARLVEVPDADWTFRGFAREGDTVFAQPRPDGFPSWEEWIRRESVSVMVAQFGQTEALSGADTNAFAQAYGALVRRWQALDVQVWLVGPFRPEGHARLDTLHGVVREVAAVHGCAFVDTQPFPPEAFRSDGVHLNERGHQAFAVQYLRSTAVGRGRAPSPHLISLVREKNRAWQLRLFPPNAHWPAPEEDAVHTLRIDQLENRLRRQFNPVEGE